MKPIMHRRIPVALLHVLISSAIASTAAPSMLSLAPRTTPLRIITAQPSECPHCALAASELGRYLQQARLSRRGLRAPRILVMTASQQQQLDWHGSQFVIAPENSSLINNLGVYHSQHKHAAHRHRHADSHTLWTVKSDANTWSYVLSGSTSHSTLHSVYSFAEDILDIRFYPHGDVVPSNVPEPDLIRDVHYKEYAPLYEVRGANTWGTWTEGFDWWTVDNWRHFITQLSKMKMNFIGMHSYPGWEPTVWIGTPEELNARGDHVVSPYAGSFTTTLKHESSYVPTNTSDYTGGGGLPFETDCCCGVNVGVDSCPIPTTGCAAARVFDDQAKVMSEAFSWAMKLKVKTALGTETPVPQSRERLDPNGKLTNTSWQSAKATYEGIFKHLNATLGASLSYYWFWTPEGYSWSKPAHNSSEWELAIGDMMAGFEVWNETSSPYAFDIATAGWTLGPKDDPVYLDKVLPVEFKALSGLTYDVGRFPDEYGNHEASGYANVTNHASWIMPWMESDDALGWVELWVNRSLDIANNATEVQGLIGLQWRTQEIMAQFSALARRGWNSNFTSNEFWLDFATANFGSEVAEQAAQIFASVDGDANSVDGRALPKFTACCPGSIHGPNSVPWSIYQEQFAFVDSFAELRRQVNGTANIARFDFWLNMFKYHTAGGQLSSLLGTYNAAASVASAIKDPIQRKAAFVNDVLPLRETMVLLYQNLTAFQLQAVNTRGAMGTIQNMEAITKPVVLDKPGMKLTSELDGMPIPQPSMAYLGLNRVFVPNLRTAVDKSEQLLIEAVVLSKTAALNVTLYYRSISSDGETDNVLKDLPPWQSTSFKLKVEGRGVWTVSSVSTSASEHQSNSQAQGTTGYLQIVACDSPMAGKWGFTSSGALAINDTYCLASVPPKTGACSGTTIELAPCSTSSPTWEVSTQPGFPTLCQRSPSGCWGPAALDGSVIVGDPVWLCSLVDNEAYCNAHHSCDYIFNRSTGLIMNPEKELCLGSGPTNPSPPHPSPIPPYAPCPSPPPPPPTPPPGTWKLSNIIEYFIVATFEDGTSASYPEGLFQNGIKDGDTVTVVQSTILS